MNSILSFPVRVGQNNYAWIYRFCPVFEKNAGAIFSSKLMRFQVQEPAFWLYNDKTAVNREKSFNFKYDEWHWEDIPGCVYIDNLKKLHPDLSHIFIFKDYRSVVNTLLQHDFEAIDLENMGKGFMAGLVWKYFKRKNACQRFYQQNAPRYLQLWLNYNDGVLKNIKKLHRDSYILLNQQYINPDDARVSAYMLKNWNISLKYLRFKQIDNLSTGTSELIFTIPDKIISTEKNIFELSVH